MFKDFSGCAKKPEAHAVPRAVPVIRAYQQHKWFIIVLVKKVLHHNI
jgi:hypothetical protein